MNNNIYIEYNNIPPTGGMSTSGNGGSLSG
jgi:hypothetical protein